MSADGFAHRFFGVVATGNTIRTHSLWRNQLICLVLGLLIGGVGLWLALHGRLPGDESFGWKAFGVGLVLLSVLGLRNECTIDLGTGVVHQTRGYLFLTTSRVFVREQIVGVETNIYEDRDRNGRTIGYSGRVDLQGDSVRIPIYHGSGNQALEFQKLLRKTVGWQSLELGD